jgi:hypothetical protein
LRDTLYPELTGCLVLGTRRHEQPRLFWLYAVSRTVRKTGQNGRKNGDIVAGLRVEKKTKI